MDDLSQSFIDDGIKAYKEGFSRIHNPHTEDTAPYYLWERGWNAARKYRKEKDEIIDSNILGIDEVSAKVFGKKAIKENNMSILLKYTCDEALASMLEDAENNIVQFRVIAAEYGYKNVLEFYTLITYEIVRRFCQKMAPRLHG